MNEKDLGKCEIEHKVNGFYGLTRGRKVFRLDGTRYPPIQRI